MREVIAVLDNIRSLHNVGSIFRTADGAGVKKLYLCGITPAPVNRMGVARSAFAKVSLGAECTIAWEHVFSTVRLLSALKKQGYMILAVEQAPGSVRYDEIKIPREARIALVVGNEVEGVSKSVMKKADAILEIPQRGAKESLNVSVAFGVVAYAVTGK